MGPKQLQRRAVARALEHVGEVGPPHQTFGTEGIVEALKGGEGVLVWWVSMIIVILLETVAELHHVVLGLVAENIDRRAYFVFSNVF